MSLDVFLIAAEPVTRRWGGGIFVREAGATVELTAAGWNARHPDRPVPAADPGGGEEVETDRVYRGNVTHNLAAMAAEAGLYWPCWRPAEVGVETAAELTPLLRAGLAALRADPGRYAAHEPANGWGSYAGLVRFAEGYLAACEAHPDARVEADR